MRERKTHPRNARQSGFSVIEVVVATTVMVVGLLAVASATTSMQLLRKRSLDEDAVFRGIFSRLELARGQLFADTPFHDAVQDAIAGGGEYQQSFVLDNNGDGTQDVVFAPGDTVTPVLTLTIIAPDPPGDPSQLLEVVVNAQWYGAGATRTRTVRELIGNRTGYGG